LAIARHVQGQDLDPRAYIRLPVNATILISGVSRSDGSVITDPAIPITDFKAKVTTPSLGVIRSFAMFKRTATVFAALPYTWASATGNVNGQAESLTRTGMSDMRVRMSLLLKGGKARTLQDFKNANLKQTIIGASLTTVIPTGQYFPDKLVNLGVNRWAFKPELALSQPVGKRWLIDFYTAIWFFTNNNSFYPGNATRAQDPIGALQAPFSYNINLRTWVALNTTFYAGGNSTVNDLGKSDRQKNFRIGITGVVPTGKLSALKFAASTGAIVNYGADFTTYSIGWQISLYKRRPGMPK
jgi:hypothetical protein